MKNLLIAVLLSLPISVACESQAAQCQQVAIQNVWQVTHLPSGVRGIVTAPTADQAVAKFAAKRKLINDPDDFFVLLIGPR